MRKVVFIITGIALAAFIVSDCLAESAKFSAVVRTTGIFDWTSVPNERCGPVMRTTMRVPNKKDLLIGLSLQTGLYTDTQVKGKAGVEDTSEAMATIKAQILLYKDESTAPLVGNPQPRMVTYDSRTQNLRAILGGYLICDDVGTFIDDDCTEVCYDNCVDMNELDCESVDPVPTSCPDGDLTFFCECGGDLLDEEIQLVLETMGSHHFNFVAKDLEQGDYEIVVVLCALTEVDDELADAKVMVGPSSLTVEQVKAVNTDAGIKFVQ